MKRNFFIIVFFIFGLTQESFAYSSDPKQFIQEIVDEAKQILVEANSKEYKTEKLSEKANDIGVAFRTKIDGIIDKAPWIKEVRGMGAMMAVEIWDPDTGEPDKERTNRIHQYALEHGLIMITAGTFGNVIRTLMPLNIDRETLEEGLNILCEALIIKS